MSDDLVTFVRASSLTSQHLLQVNLAILRNQILAQAPHWKLIHHGFRLYSKSEEDGIIQEIFKRIGATSRVFWEIGAECGTECNTAKLLVEGWTGTWIEADPQNVDRMRKHFAPFITENKLKTFRAFVTPENVKGFVADNLDLLVIDIDGNDYWVWKAIEARPRVVVIEYNPSYAPPMSIVTPYNEGKWDNSNFFGASLGALFKLGAAKGYTLVGCDISGSNAFFVLDEYASEFHPGSLEDLYEPQRCYFSLGQYNPPSPRPFVVV